MQIERLDDDPFRDIAVAVGDEIAIIHGWSRKPEVDPQAYRTHQLGLSCPQSGCWFLSFGIVKLTIR